MFTLVDSDGNPVEGQQLGLLLYRGGTVCDDGFDDTAAEAVCRQINSSYRMIKWTTGQTFDIQNNLDINLDDVQCNSTDWGSCEYSEENNCDHSEDVFLTCENPKGIPNSINLSFIQEKGVVTLSGYIALYTWNERKLIKLLYNRLKL